MHFLLLILFASNSLYAVMITVRDFPIGPEQSLTPGSLCDQPDSYRYPQRIPYCDRDSMHPGTKDYVFEMYRKRGYRLNPGTRSDYKIDHLVPLCAGGSNREDNLWPQHKTLFVKTDPLEPLGCEKLKQGRITQSALINLIITAKKNLSRVQPTLEYLKSL